MGFLLTSSKSRLVIAYLLLFAMIGLPVNAAQKIPSWPTSFEPDRIAWRSLSYKVNNIFGKVVTDVYLSTSAAEEVADLLITDPKGEALQPSGATVSKLTVHSRIDPLLGFEEILKTQSWFDPNGAGALQRIRQRLGQRKWQRSYRFTKKGVFRLKKIPKDSREENLPLEKWTKIRNHFYLYGDSGLECPQILEPASLLYIVSAIDLTTVHPPLNLCVFNKKQLHLVKVSVGGSQSLQVNYLEKLGDSQTRVDKKIDTIKISFQPLSLAPTDIEPEAFSFLGLKGDFDIFIDKTSRIPVQVSGKIATFGKIDIRLQTVEFAQKH